MQFTLFGKLYWLYVAYTLPRTIDRLFQVTHSSVYMDRKTGRTFVTSAVHPDLVRINTTLFVNFLGLLVNFSTYNSANQ